MNITASVDQLSYLESLRQKMQRHRIQMGNRIAAIESERSSGDLATAEYFAGRFSSIEGEIATVIATTVKEHPAWPWLDKVKGVGPGLAGALLAPVDIRRADTVSALWRYAGQGLTNGERDRPRKGEKLIYNAALKRTCYLVGTSFMRANSPYRKVYDEAKEFYLAEREWTKGHCDMAARRKMVKIFLSHLWVVWRDLEGLPLTSPYVSQTMNHDGIFAPWEFTPDFEYGHAVKQHYAGISRYARPMAAD